MAGTLARTTVDQRRSVLVVAGLVLGALGIWATLASNRYARESDVELVVLSALAVAAGLFSFVTVNSSGAIVVINPAVCFTFAIMLTWGLLPALAAHLAALAILIWRRRLPLLGAVLMMVQFALAFGAAYTTLLLLSGRALARPVRNGQDWATPDRDRGRRGVACCVYGLRLRRDMAPLAERQRQFPPPTGYGLLFNAALVVLSPEWRWLRT